MVSIPKISKLHSVSNTAHEVLDAGLSAVKITLSEVGFWRQVIRFGMIADTGRPRPPEIGDPYESEMDEANKYVASHKSPDRLATANECVWKCGDYFLPLSLSYSLSANKNLALSQLVDGAEIIQRTAKKAKTIEVTVRVRQKPNAETGDETFDNTDFILAGEWDHWNGDKVAPGVTSPGAYSYSLASLASVLSDLYENKDVFIIDNATINGIFGVTYVVMEKLDFNPNQGSTMADIRMMLREVNMDENAIIFGEATVNSDKSAGGGAR